ncbi:MAG: hypothetical protein HUU16_16610 [Candidatus Omnitrophica bacterium]|nr:hypothetical protein [bacterium]NUN97786.1 hypothetical protein [Candidatus Omnitrophota bacterium]
MSAITPRINPKEHARKGDLIYQNQVRPMVEAGHQGRVVAIDVDSSDYELADNMIDAADRLLARNPDAQIWFVRIGHRGVHRIGKRSSVGA